MIYYLIPNLVKLRSNWGQVGVKLGLSSVEVEGKLNNPEEMNNFDGQLYWSELPCSPLRPDLRTTDMLVSSVRMTHLIVTIPRSCLAYAISTVACNMSHMTTG